MKKLSPIQKDIGGRRYYYAQVALAEVQLSPYAFKEIRPGLVDQLIKDIEVHGILEPVTLYEDQEGKLWLAGGKHRRKAAEEHDERLADDDTSVRWMSMPVDAKVYLDLPRNDVPGIVMALDDVRKQAAAGERQVGLALDYRETLDAIAAQGDPTDEESVLKGVTYVRARLTRRGGKDVIPQAAARAVIIANHIQRLSEESRTIAGMLTQRQVPRRTLEEAVANRDYRLLTRENLQFCLRHLVRSAPVTAAELGRRSDPREIEYQNLKRVLEALAKEVIIPLADADIDQAIGLCRRHPIEGVGMYLQNALTRLYGVDSDEPLARRRITPWDKLQSALAKLSEFNWADPVLQGYRSATEIYRGVPGKGYPKALRDLLDQVT